jgi:ferric-dicitrate binding protein FerR (iron transport regulator)
VTVEPRDLAAHLVPEITEGRLARQWASLESKLPRPQTGPGWRSAALAVSALGLAAVLWWMPAQRPESGALVESSDTPVGVQLSDGSSVELAAQTRLRVLRDQPSGVEVELAST